MLSEAGAKSDFFSSFGVHHEQNFPQDHAMKQPSKTLFRAGGGLLVLADRGKDPS